MSTRSPRSSQALPGSTGHGADVDTESGIDVGDVGSESGPVVGSLCTGYGGLDLGVLAALGGGRIAWVADPDPHIAQILDARMPEIPNLGDLRRIDWTTVTPVDVLVAVWTAVDALG